jgi:structural maintenance of chromosome 2
MESNLREKKESYNNVNKEYASFKVTYDEKTEEMNTTSELIQTLTTGVSAEEGHENGYMEQLQKSKNNANKASTAVEQASLKMKHMNKELGEKEQQLKNAKNENQGAMVQLEKKQSEIGELEKQLSALDWNPDHETSLQKERTYVQDTLSNLNEVSTNAVYCCQVLNTIIIIIITETRQTI